MPAAAQVASTRERLLQAAMELFTTKGYEATSIAEILERAGVNSGSLYYLFKSKEELLLAGLDYFKTLLYPIVIGPAFEQEADPIEKIFAVLGFYRERLLFCDMDYECPMGKLALEVGRHLPAAREKIAMNFEAWRAHIRECLDVVADRLPSSVDLDALATFVMTVMEGGLMQARTHRDIAFYDRSVEQLRSYFEYLMAEKRS